MVKKDVLFHFILFYLTISITYRKKITLHIRIKYIKVFSDQPDNSSSDSLDGRKPVLLLNGRLNFNREIIEFQPLFPFSFVLGSMFQEDKVSSLNKFEGVFAQRHSFMRDSVN